MLYVKCVLCSILSPSIELVAARSPCGNIQNKISILRRRAETLMNARRFSSEIGKYLKLGIGVILICAVPDGAAPHPQKD